MKEGLIRSICVRPGSEMLRRTANERGQALPIVLGILALGTMVVSPFLGHASASLISTQSYKEMLCEQYSADAGVEEAIWRLVEDDLSSQIPEVNDRTTYTMSGEINGIQPVVTVTRISCENNVKHKDKGKDEDKAKDGKKYQDSDKDNRSVFHIKSLAGSTAISAGVSIEDGVTVIDTWRVDK
ncbi:MAG: hypothetical protein JXA46_19440 [Dehalococcoidales bacterium]|nr:hypothetical protein [Dehalococcoidales bacterium]